MRKKQIGSRKSPSGRSRGGTVHKAKPTKPGSQTASLIIGIGASAGGLGAFKAFFSNMPPDSGMTFVLVQHLAPDHKSLLADLIGKVTAMPVIEAENETAVAPNTVYVIPPDATLTFRRRSLQVSKPAPPRERRRPIDTFFSSLAEEQGENAVCIVLSGAGTDGTLGLKTIKERGGLTLAQAEHDSTAMSGMPQSATATGLVDAVMPVEDMPAKLLDYQRHLLKVASKKDDDGTRFDAGEHLAKISSLLRARVGHDFSKYKDKTMVRRIQRRMQVLQIDTVPAYAARLKEDPHQIDLLFRELLIGVTQFFRDPSAFVALATVAIPELLERTQADDQLRIWVPACATGEEVYSIAILLKEALIDREASPRVQIFGTDIDENAAAFARSGRYRKTTGLSPERLARWFAEDGDEHCPIKAIREMCVFSTHSVVKDPPFSRLDLISCRNLLIYMDGDLQDRVLRTFHYALRPDGILFLGPAEGTSRQSRLFGTLDKKHRIFRRRAADVTLPELSSPPGSMLRHSGYSSRTIPGIDRVERRAKRIADKYSPVHLVVDRNHQIVRFSGGAVGHYLEPSAGTPSFNLFDIIRKALRPIVRSALQEALARKGPVTRDDVRLRIDGQSRSVTVVVEPISDARNADEWLCVIVFQHALNNPGQQAAGDSPAEEADSGNLRALQHELLTTRTQLQSTIDDFETANEEMKSAGEEYQSLNEELQSSNEELETSKEEMQSINEELQTVNTELASKNDALTKLNNDLKNLLDSTEIATIFLDNDLRIKNFTRGMVDIFRLRDVDRGRPVTDIATALSYAELSDDARTVLRNLSVVEKQVELRDKQTTFVMRIRPYRTVDNAIGGVVITFVDISARRRSDDQRNVLLQELNHRVKNTLATVQAIALQTFRYTDTRETFRDTFLNRLMALSKTHNLLTASNWAGASLRDVLLSELAPYQAGSHPRFAIEGDDTQLDAHLTLALGLAFHELATNAVKHGALSVPAGRVAIRWEIDTGDGRLRLRWIETGGPRVEKPARRGMGLRVIESGLMHELGGRSRIDFDPSGVQCSIEIPMPRREETS
jgi:two-component system, chemotaxis family, CheB/CheR fusion protein